MAIADELCEKLAAIGQQLRREGGGTEYYRFGAFIWRVRVPAPTTHLDIVSEVEIDLLDSDCPPDVSLFTRLQELEIQAERSAEQQLDDWVI